MLSCQEVKLLSTINTFQALCMAVGPGDRGFASFRAPLNVRRHCGRLVGTRSPVQAPTLLAQAGRSTCRRKNAQEQRPGATSWPFLAVFGAFSPFLRKSAPENSVEHWSGRIWSALPHWAVGLSVCGVWMCKATPRCAEHLILPKSGCRAHPHA